jgi:4-hydroxy-tetrahydrodipicolinate synthase
MDKREGGLAMEVIGRVLPAMVTPYQSSGEISLKRAQRLAVDLDLKGADGLVVAGTTGSSAVLESEEKLELFEAVGDAVGKDLVVCGTGSNNTKHAIELTARAHRRGFNNFLVVTPYYFKASQTGLYQHYAAILKEFPDAQFILYCVQGRTGQTTEPETIVRLANDFPNLAGVKDADGVAHAESVWNLLEESRQLHFWSGNDGDTHEMMVRGFGYGVIGVDLNLFAAERAKMVQLLVQAQREEDGGEKQGLIRKARAIHSAFTKLGTLLMSPSDPSPAGIRHLVGKNWGPIGTDRKPAWPPSDRTREALDTEYEAVVRHFKQHPV